MSFAENWISRIGSAALLLGGCAALLAVAGRGLATETANDSGQPQAQSPSVLPPLPVVARPAPQQPAAGLPADTHLDKTPPRATKGLDLVKSGWAYNCMECHKVHR